MKDYIEIIKDKSETPIIRGFFIVMFPIYFPFIIIAWLFDLIFKNK